MKGFNPKNGMVRKYSIEIKYKLLANELNHSLF